MRIFKSHPLLKIVNSYLIDSPQPSNISYWWNFGSLLALSLGIQIVTGVTLAMHVRCGNSVLSWDIYVSIVPLMAVMSSGLGIADKGNAEHSIPARSGDRNKPLKAETARHYTYDESYTTRITLTTGLKLGAARDGNRGLTSLENCSA
jgi:hypothetical protein